MIVNRSLVISYSRSVLADVQAGDHEGFVMKSARRSDLFLKSGVYKIRCCINGEFYIGASGNLYSRKNEHLAALRKNEHYSKELQKVYNEYGSDSLEFLVIEYCNIDFLLDREQFYIDMLKPKFNSSPTAGSNRGIKYRTESIQKSAENRRGLKRTEEQRRKFSQARLNTSYVVSEETKKKMSKSQKEREGWKKSVLQIDLKSGEIIQIFSSVQEAEEKTGIAKSSISRVCIGSTIVRKNRGGKKQILKSAGGYGWRFQE